MPKINEDEIDSLCDDIRKRVNTETEKLKEIQLIGKSLQAIQDPFIVVEGSTDERDDNGIALKIKQRTGVKKNPFTGDKFSDSERQQILTKAKNRLKKLA